MLHAQLAIAALKGVMAELEGDPALAAQVLGRLLQGEPPARVARAPRVPRPPAPKPRQGRRAAAKDARDLVAQLVERHGSVRAVAERLRVNPSLVRRWGSGRVSAAPATIDRLRRLLAADPAEDQTDPRKEQPRGEENGEAPGLVAALVTAQGSLSGAALRFGFKPAELTRWRDGGACGASALARLRSAVAQSAAHEKQPRGEVLDPPA